MLQIVSEWRVVLIREIMLETGTERIIAFIM